MPPASGRKPTPRRVSSPSSNATTAGADDADSDLRQGPGAGASEDPPRSGIRLRRSREAGAGDAGAHGGRSTGDRSVGGAVRRSRPQHLVPRPTPSPLRPGRSRPGRPPRPSRRAGAEGGTHPPDRHRLPRPQPPSPPKSRPRTGDERRGPPPSRRRRLRPLGSYPLRQVAVRGNRVEHPHSLLRDDRANRVTRLEPASGGDAVGRRRTARPPKLVMPDL